MTTSGPFLKKKNQKIRTINSQVQHKSATSGKEVFVFKSVNNFKKKIKILTFVNLRKRYGKVTKKGLFKGQFKGFQINKTPAVKVFIPF